jgi:sporulation protein YlmC with PRC-barrel domain
MAPRPPAKEDIMTHKLVPSDRVEGMPVFLPDGEKIGTIERLMIDKITGQIAYAVLKTRGFLGLGTKHFPVLWQALKYNPQRKSFEITISEAPCCEGMIEDAGEELDLGERTPVHLQPQYWTT